MNQALVDLIKHNKPYHLEFDIITHNRRERKTILSIAELERDENGNPIKITGVIQDITHRKRAEKELKESEERYRSLVENANMGIGYFSLDGKVRMLNQKAYKFMGVESQDELFNKSMIDMFGVDAGNIYLDRIKASANSESVIVYEDFVSVPAGDIWFRSVYSRVLDANQNILGIQIISEDITEQKKAESQKDLFTRELEQKNNELESFSYTISHDLKNPMITVEGFIGVLENDINRGQFDKAKYYMDLIRDAIKKMDALLKDILELSRIGRIIYPPVHIPFQEVVDEMMLVLKPRLENDEVEIEIEDDLPTVFCDKTRIIEVMINLVENAYKYMGEQKEPIIQIGSQERAQEYLIFVSDNGIGIEPKYHDKVFQLFDQLNPNANGTGLGLALVKRIIDVHNGKIWIESEGKGKGTTVFFTLPKYGSKNNFK